MRRKQTIFKTLSFGIIAILFPLTALAQDMSGWRSPSQSDLGDDSEWRKESKDLYLLAKADFDGDGKEDEACLMINDKENKLGLFVFLSRHGKTSPLLLDAMSDKKWVEVMGVAVAKPGAYKTACGKGYWACEKDEPPVLKLERPAIDFFKAESANSFFVWDGMKKEFNKI
jgi:hypothetical protein